MSTIVYKVVDKNLRSAIVGKGSVADNSLEVQYLENQWVCPIDKNAPLMAFLEIEDAKTFLKHNRSGMYIYKAEAIISKKKWGWVYNVTKVLKLKRNKKKISNFIQLDGYIPNGTIFCDKIKLIERL